MKTDLEQRFFEAFELGGVADSCLRLVIDGSNDEDTPEQRRIIEETSKFDFSIINSKRIAPIFQEIRDNLHLLSDRERECYIYSLLTPFYDWMRIIRGIADEDESEWSKERLKHRAKQIFNILNGEYKRGSVERALQEWSSVVIHYSNRLDAVLLQEGEDLLKYQQITGVRLIEHRDLSALEYYCGSMGVVRKYIADLNPTPQPDTSTPVITDLVIAPSTGATPTTGGTAPEGWRLPMELDTERARKYFARAIERGFILPTSTGFKWIREARKGQGVNTLIALLGGMIYCGDEIVNSRYGDKWKLGDGGIFPDEELKQLFGVKSLGAIRTNGLDSSRQKTAPRGWRDIVELFED